MGDVDKHVDVIRTLARKRSGMTRKQLRAKAGLSTGGHLTTVLSELENTGFILRSVPFAPQRIRHKRRLDNKPRQGCDMPDRASTGSTPAYVAGSGYDLATGLGSLNAANLIGAFGYFEIVGLLTGAAYRWRYTSKPRRGGEKLHVSLR